MPNNTVTDADFRIATRPPRHTDVPDYFTIPEALTKALKIRDKSYDAWVDAEDQATGAWLEVGNAYRADGLALREAIAAGKGDPGTERSDRAERALVVELERVRQARAKAEAADNDVAKLYRESALTFVPQATARARQGMETYAEKLAQAKALVSEARAALLASYAGLTEVRDAVAPAMQYTPPSRVPEVLWNDNDWHTVRGYLMQLCDNVEKYGTAQAEREGVLVK